MPGPFGHKVRMGFVVHCALPLSTAGSGEKVMVKTCSVFHWHIKFLKPSLKNRLLAFWSFFCYFNISVDVNIKTQISCARVPCIKFLPALCEFNTDEGLNVARFFRETVTGGL